MLRKARLFPLLILAAVLTACQEDPIAPSVYNVPDIIQPYVDAFEQEASLRGISLNINNLQVEFATNLNSGTAAGLCDTFNHVIKLDTTSTNWKNNLYTREILVFHELGHCVLKRGHRDDELPNGNLASIMRANGEQVYGGGLNEFKRQYYLDELFNVKAPAPDWALQTPGYADLAPTDRTNVFFDDFDFDHHWNLAVTPQSSAEVRNGRLIFKSLQDNAAIYLPKTVPFDENGNFEIETSFRITSGTQSALMQWGGSGPENFYYFGFNRDANTSFAGNWRTGIDLTRVGTPLDKNSFNTFSIRKVGPLYYFYLNEQFYDVFEFLPFYGQDIAFYIGPQTTMEVDYVRVSEF
jgi:hypothetical protein